MASRCARLAEAEANEEMKTRLLHLKQRWLEHAAKADAYYLSVNRQAARPDGATADQVTESDESYP
jgi:hemerythrin